MQLKVIIADDEERVCKLIQMLADWEALQMEVVATAHNGLEALECVMEHRPDILITDIRMPGCHGLDLIARAKEQQPSLQVVIISGYAHFEYAQTAIKHGVGDYLLKPIKKSELMQTLQKLGENCQHQREAVDEMTQMKQVMQADTKRLQEKWLWDLVQGRTDMPSKEQMEKDYHIDIQEGLFQAFAIKLDYDQSAFGEASLLVIWDKIEKIFHLAMTPLCYAFVLHTTKTTAFGFLHYAEGQRNNMRRALRECHNQLVAKQSFFGDVICSVALGQEVAHCEQTGASLQSAKEALLERWMEGTARLLEKNETKKEVDISKALERYTSAITYACDRLDVAQNEEALLGLKAFVAEHQGMTGKTIQQLIHQAADIFLLRLHDADHQALITTFDQKCDQCYKLQQLWDVLDAFQTEQLHKKQEEQRNLDIRPVRMAKQYVQEHFDENITLDTICTKIGFSSSYFSVVFKKETGEGFLKYLTHVRMEKAKELLQQTSYSLPDICSRVGYSDVKHFTSTFKKATQLSPAQYRKLFG